MKIDTSIMERIRTEFDTLWSAKRQGCTIEIVMPYAMPNSTFLTLYLTERDGRFIASEGGDVWDMLRERTEWQCKELAEALRSMAALYQMREGDLQGTPIFFKECREEKCIGSIVFDVATFAVAAANTLMHTEP